MEYNPVMIAPSDVAGVLAARGLVAADVTNAPRPAANSGIDNLAGTIGSWLIRELAERLVLGAIGALA